MDCSNIIRTRLDLLGRLRREHTPKQKDFAEKADINIEHYSSIENNATEIFMSTFLRICYHLGIKIWLDTPWGFFSLFKPEDLEQLQPKQGEIVRKKRGTTNKKKAKIKTS